MLKLLILGVVIYAYYKFFLAPKKISTRDQQKIDRENRGEEEYSDYEEIE